MKRNIVIACFLGLWMLLLCGIGVFFVFGTEKESTYSEEENRNLAGMPIASVAGVFSGDFTGGIESFLLDHFPGRGKVIAKIKEWQNLISFASYEDYVLVAEGPDDPLDSDDYLTDLDALVGDMVVTDTPAPVVSEEPVLDVTPQPSAIPKPTAMPEPTAIPEPTEYPPIVEKPIMTEADFVDTLGVYMERDGKVRVTNTYEKKNVMAVTAVLNRYAEILPEDGKLMFTVVPQSIYANQFVNAKDKQSYYADWDDVVNGLGRDNVYAFDAAEILTDAMKNGEYVFFRTDMHWTPYGSFLVYKEMAERAGKVPCDYEADFVHTLEEPFRGTYYRDNPTAYMDVEADSLDLLMPDFALEWRRTTGKDSYKLIDFLNFHAKANDRYTVYLGGPAGPWTYAECENGQEENCLVITDSFGLGYIPFLTANYKQVHYYDPRYYSRETVGYTVAEMMELYDIQDIYVVVGDLHSFDSSFLLTNANRQLYGQ